MAWLVAMAFVDNRNSVFFGIGSCDEHRVFLAHLFAVNNGGASPTVPRRIGVVSPIRQVFQGCIAGERIRGAHESVQAQEVGCRIGLRRPDAGFDFEHGSGSIDGFRNRCKARARDRIRLGFASLCSLCQWSE